MGEYHGSRRGWAIGRWGGVERDVYCTDTHTRSHTVRSNSHKFLRDPLQHYWYTITSRQSYRVWRLEILGPPSVDVLDDDGGGCSIDASNWQ